jgi:hypothetical protein
MFQAADICLKFFLSQTSLVNALLRFLPTRRNITSGRSWGIFPNQGTYQQADSASALLRSSCSMSGCTSVSSVVFSSVLSSVVLLLAFFCNLDVLLEWYVMYPTPLVISSKLSLFKFCCVDLFSVLHLLAQSPVHCCWCHHYGPRLRVSHLSRSLAGLLASFIGQFAWWVGQGCVFLAELAPLPHASFVG